MSQPQGTFIRLTRVSEDYADVYQCSSETNERILIGTVIQDNGGEQLWTPYFACESYTDESGSTPTERTVAPFTFPLTVAGAHTGDHHENLGISKNKIKIVQNSPISVQVKSTTRIAAVDFLWVDYANGHKWSQDTIHAHKHPDTMK